MRTDHWEEYYRGGWIVSSPMGSRDGYTGDLLSTWQAFFAELPPGARIIDIGTGNGAIPLIARDVAVARRRMLDIHGVDVAAIDPPACVEGGAQRYQGITFHPNTAAESLPFDDASTEAVTGQYALEYTDVAATLREVARVLVPAGRCLFVLHHADSILAANARVSIEHGRLVTRQTRVFERLRQYLEAERLEPGRARVLYRQLVQIGSDLRTAAAQSPNAHVLDAALSVLARTFAARGRAPTSDLLKVIEQAEHALRAGRRRLDDLIGAARTREQMDEICTQAVAEGLSGSFVVQHHVGDTLIGWRLSLQRGPEA